MKTYLTHSLVPLSLIVTTCNYAVCMVNFVIGHGANVSHVSQVGFQQFVLDSWDVSNFVHPESWGIVAAILLWGAASLYLGGKTYYGPTTISGFRPVYRDSGFVFYVVSLVLSLVLLWYPTDVSYMYYYKLLIPISASFLLFSLFFTVFLYLKGVWFPSPGDHGTSGSIIFDYYWGRELYPRLGKRFDIKKWTNCRVGLLVWQLVVLLCWRAQYEMSGWNSSMAAVALLQTIYLGKFYWWESGYMASLDIILDRAGYYICWGCLCFVPTFYTLTSIYMVEHAPLTSERTNLAWFTAGLLFIILNYWTDYQRQYVRNFKGKDSDCKLWGKPVVLIKADYRDAKHKKKTSKLLASGFWGWSRHLNYVFELGLAFCWSAPAQFGNILPFCYVIFLTILLVHRSFRDDDKCSIKYGKHWKHYCSLVPYRIFPGIF